MQVTSINRDDEVELYLVMSPSLFPWSWNYGLYSILSLEEGHIYDNLPGKFSAYQMLAKFGATLLREDLLPLFLLWFFR